MPGIGGATGTVFVPPLAHPVRLDETSETGGDAGPHGAELFRYG